MSEDSFKKNINLILDNPEVHGENFLDLFTPDEQGPAFLAILEAVKDFETSYEAIEAMNRLMMKKTSQTLEKLVAENFDAVFEFAQGEDQLETALGLTLLAHGMPALNDEQKAKTLDMLFDKTNDMSQYISGAAIGGVEKAGQDSLLRPAYQAAVARNFKSLENLSETFDIFALDIMAKNIHVLAAKDQESVMSMLWANMNEGDNYGVQIAATDLIEDLYKNKETRPVYLKQMHQDFGNAYHVAQDDSDEYSLAARMTAFKALNRTVGMMSDEEKSQALKMSKKAVEDKFIYVDVSDEAKKLIKKLSPKKEKPNGLKAALAVITLGALSLFVKPAKAADRQPSNQPRPVTITANIKQPVVSDVAVFKAAVATQGKKHTGRN